VTGDTPHVELVLAVGEESARGTAALDASDAKNDNLLGGHCDLFIKSKGDGIEMRMGWMREDAERAYIPYLEINLEIGT